MRIHGTTDRHWRSSSAGFTLVELIVTIAVAAILTAISVPAFRSFLLNDRSVSQATSLLLSLNLARSEAIKQDLASGVTVCPSTDGATCNGGANWAQGWIVLSSTASGATAVISVVPSLATGSTLSVTPTGTTQITFLSDGSASTVADFTLCDSRGAQFARYTDVSATGRVSAPPVGQNTAGTALTCP